jgi:hypothetical protein
VAAPTAPRDSTGISPDDQPQATGNRPQEPRLGGATMSPHLHYQIARARQQEIASRASDSYRSHATRRTVNRQRGVKHRLAQVAAALVVCATAGTAVAFSDAHPHQRPIKQQTVHVSPKQLANEIRTFEAKGYVPTSCTVSGTLMRNYSTGQSVTVNW